VSATWVEISACVPFKFGNYAFVGVFRALGLIERIYDEFDQVNCDQVDVSHLTGGLSTLCNVVMADKVVDHASTPLRCSCLISLHYRVP
jgi:hypothetical protein